jgi:excisionase family DNA binding protein
MYVLPGYLTRAQAADLLNCHVQTINNYLNSGRLTRHKAQNGYTVMIKVREIENLLAPQAV